MSGLPRLFAVQLPAGGRFPPLSDLETILWPGIILSAFVATTCVVELIALAATRWKLIDVPNQRSAHSIPTARGGGGAIVFTITVGSVLAALKWESHAFALLVGCLLPSLVIGLVGLADDIRPLNAKLRLVVQIAVSIWMAAVLGPIEAIQVLGLPPVLFGIIGWPLTVIWIVGMINAFNFMDGSDGMAGTCGAVGGFAVAVLGFLAWIPPLIVLGGLLAASCSGFLVFNWQPARIFMGDVGSAFLGCYFAAIPLLVDGSQRSEMFVPIVLGLWPVVYDPLVSVLRRVASGRNPLQPHREFFFHKLVRSGLSHSQVAILYGGLSLMGGLAAICMLVPLFDARARLAMLAFMCGFAAVFSWRVEILFSRRVVGQENP
jgi:UDP-N-acetylmuramyl pentapeptide phosphotransferase/UDP-N-acetylglucosamine-1-phosphate transferase